MQIITSKDNELVKHIKKLKDKKQRDISKEYVIEGIKLIQEAIQEKAKIKKIVICEECEKVGNISKELMYEIAKYECIYVTAKVYEYITEVKTPQGILAIISQENSQELIDYSADIMVALDGIQDPGNLGTILRTIDSIGLKQILVSKETADVYNPKVVRSTMGAIFRIKIIECENLEETLKEIKKQNFNIITTSLQTDKTIYEINYNKSVIVIGNEANGVSKNIQKIANQKVKIPMLRKNREFKCFCCNRNCFI